MSREAAEAEPVEEAFRRLRPEDRLHIVAQELRRIEKAERAAQEATKVDLFAPSGR